MSELFYDYYYYHHYVFIIIAIKSKGFLLCASVIHLFLVCFICWSFLSLSVYWHCSTRYATAAVHINYPFLFSGLS